LSLQSHGTPNGFDFTFHVRRLCIDAAGRLPELRHIDVERVAIRYVQTRRDVQHGLQASLMPMRYEGGGRETVRGGRRWAVEPLYDASGRESLYLLSFYLPRFLNLPFREKLTTIFHELWHIGPRFDGDLRRWPGRCYAHGPCERRYDEAMEQLSDKWLALDPPEYTFAFLRPAFRELRRTHGRVYGRKIPTPKLRLLDADGKVA